MNRNDMIQKSPIQPGQQEHKNTEEKHLGGGTPQIHGLCQVETVETVKKIYLPKLLLFKFCTCFGHLDLLILHETLVWSTGNCHPNGIRAVPKMDF